MTRLAPRSSLATPPGASPSDARPGGGQPPPAAGGLRSARRLPAQDPDDHFGSLPGCRRGRSPWWFGSSGEGRFDLPPPDGTCYLAADELGALLEAVGPDRDGGAVSTEFLAARCLWRLRAPAERRLGDLTARRARGFGITAEIGTLVPYDLPQAWAARLHAAGFQGLVYWLRHDPARSEGIALFGPEGGAAEDWPEGEEIEIVGPAPRPPARRVRHRGRRHPARRRASDRRASPDSARGGGAGPTYSSPRSFAPRSSSSRWSGWAMAISASARSRRFLPKRWAVPCSVTT